MTYNKSKWESDDEMNKLINKEYKKKRIKSRKYKSENTVFNKVWNTTPYIKHTK